MVAPWKATTVVKRPRALVKLPTQVECMLGTTCRYIVALFISNSMKYWKSFPKVSRDDTFVGSLTLFTIASTVNSNFPTRIAYLSINSCISTEVSKARLINPYFSPRVLQYPSPNRDTPTRAIFPSAEPCALPLQQSHATFYSLSACRRP
jgi:hypothetical protein